MMKRLESLTVGQRECVAVAARMRVSPDTRAAFFADMEHALAMVDRWPPDDDAVADIVKRLLGVKVYRHRRRSAAQTKCPFRPLVRRICSKSKR